MIRRKCLSVLAALLSSLFCITGESGADYLFFNGIDNYVEIQDDPRLSGGPGRSLTVEAWISPISSGGYRRNVISKYLHWNTKDWGMFIETDNTLAFQQEGAGQSGNWYVWSSEAIPLNQWTHLAFVFDNDLDIVNVYLNGILRGSRNLVGDLPDTNAVVWLGGPGPFYYSRYGTEMFHGYIDDVRIWDVARTETNIRNNMLAGSISGGEDGLAAYWDFERGADTSVLYDRTGNSNNGAIVGATWSEGNAPPIPEPSTILLLTTGLVGIGAYGFRRKRKRP